MRSLTLLSLADPDVSVNAWGSDPSRYCQDVAAHVAPYSHLDSSIVQTTRRG